MFRSYFARRFKTIVLRERAKQRKELEEDREKGGRSLMRRLSGSLTLGTADPVSFATKGFRKLAEEETRAKNKKRSTSPTRKPNRKLRADMIRRLDFVPQPINPLGLVESNEKEEDQERQAIHLLKRTSCRSPFTSTDINTEPMTSPAMARAPTSSEGRRTHTVGFDLPENGSLLRHRGNEGEVEYVDRGAYHSYTRSSSV